MKIGGPNIPPATVAETREVAPTAPVAPSQPQQPVAPADQMSTTVPAAALAPTSAPPPETASSGLQGIADLIRDPNFGERPNARPGLSLVDPDFKFDPELLGMDMGAWFANEIKANPTGDKTQQMKALLEHFPDGLAALDPALVGGLG